MWPFGRELVEFTERWEESGKSVWLCLYMVLHSHFISLPFQIISLLISRRIGTVSSVQLDLTEWWDYWCLSLPLCTKSALGIAKNTFNSKNFAAVLSDVYQMRTYLFAFNILCWYCQGNLILVGAWNNSVMLIYCNNCNFLGQ